MGMRGSARTFLNNALERFGSEVVLTESLYEWQRFRATKPAPKNRPLPADAAQYLKPDNPWLIELRNRYRAFDSEVTMPCVWTEDHLHTEDIAWFRGDNAWVWQVRGTNTNILAYALSFYYLKSIDRLGLFDKLAEDDKFGSFTFAIAERVVSRDLLDSIAEIYFLDRHLGIGSLTGFRALDIGAGYGRLAHRMVSALPGLEKYLCSDAVAASTFVSDYYLRFRGIEKARVIPLDEIDATLRDNPVDLAINIHSFSECRPQAIEWWARLLNKHRVRHLMVVPNRTDSNGDRLLTNDGYDFLPILERHGYRSVLREPKYPDPVVQKYGLQPSWHHLLELRDPA